MNQIIKTVSFAALPALGADFEGGTFRGITTLQNGTHAAVILLPNKAQERLNWAAAGAWAAEVGGELPSRPVAALLYANAKDQFERTWYWTGDELQIDTGDDDDASSAWYCTFFNGYQDFNHKSSEGSAVAVRLIHLTA